MAWVMIFMKFKLIAADIDGTLLNHESRLTERTKKAAKAAMDAGAMFVLSSGRMPESLANISRELNANAPAVCYTSTRL